MTEIAVTSNWRGRSVRVWTQVYDPTGTTPKGAVIPFYTGYASSVKIMPAPDSQSIVLEVENYLSLFSASGLLAACRLALARMLAKVLSCVPYCCICARPAPPK